MNKTSTSTPKPAVLDVRGLRMERGRTVILDDVGFSIAPGEHWALIGPNGSGKTSLLSALTGYLSPTAGSIAVLDQVYGESDWRDLRLKVGVVSSSIRHLMAESETVLESVVSGKYAMIDYRDRVSGADRTRAANILRQIDCQHLTDRPWIFLSQGERQRILIGRALMADPALLILDEPCAGLDPAAREHFLQFLQRLGERRRGPTLVLVTHHVEEIMPVFSHTMILSAGKVFKSGPTRTVLTADNLTKVFRTRIRLVRRTGRFQMTVEPRPGKIV